MSGVSLNYYRAALALLGHVEARQPTNRRFGPEADALWARFEGGLTPADRLDVLLRDADAQWPGAFGARTVFNLPGVAEDEAFGAEWALLEGVEAADLWKAEARPSLASPREVLEAIARAWELSLASASTEPVGAAEALLVAGPSAVASLIEYFAGAEGLDWAEQVTVIATPPAHRQLAAAGGAILGSTRPTRLFDSTAGSLGKGAKARLVVSRDAAPEDAARARVLAGES
jgi:hypothetical protein